MDDLKTQIDQVKDEHALVVVAEKGRDFDTKAKMEAAFILGRIKQNENIAQAVATSLHSQTILALERVQEERLYLRLGYDTFDQFLDKDPMSPFTRTQYYTRRKLMEEHSPEVFDLLTTLGVSVRSQRLITGELSIKDGRLMIGDQQIEMTNSGVIKDAIEELANDKRELEKQATRDAKKISDQAQQIDRGIQDNEQLQRNLDALSSGSPYDRDLTRAFQTLLELAESIGQLPDAQKAARGRDAMPVLWSAIQQVKAAYGSPFAFTDAPPSKNEPGDDVLAEMAREVNSTDDDEEGLDQ